MNSCGLELRVASNSAVDNNFKVRKGLLVMQFKLFLFVLEQAVQVYQLPGLSYLISCLKQSTFLKF